MEQTYTASHSLTRIHNKLSYCNRHLYKCICVMYYYIWRAYTYSIIPFGSQLNRQVFFSSPLLVNDINRIIFYFSSSFFIVQEIRIERDFQKRQVILKCVCVCVCVSPRVTQFYVCFVCVCFFFGGLVRVPMWMCQVQHKVEFVLCEAIGHMSI